MSWQANDQIMMFQVTWKYDYFTTTFKKFEHKNDVGVANTVEDNTI